MFDKSKKFLHWHFPSDTGDKPFNDFDEEIAELLDFPEFEDDEVGRNVHGDHLMDDDEWKAD